MPVGYDAGMHFRRRPGNPSHPAHVLLGASSAAAAALSILLTGCAGSGGPKGQPLDVVKGAPELTFAAGTTRIHIAGPDLRADGVVDLATGAARLTVVNPGTGATSEVVTANGVGPSDGPHMPGGLALTDVRGLVDLLRGTVKVYTYGGAEVQGIDTIRYTIDDDDLALAVEATPPARRASVERARDLAGGRPTIKIDVWVDAEGRIRRIQIPTDLTTKTPPTRVDGAPVAFTVDFLEFGVPAPAVGP